LHALDNRQSYKFAAETRDKLLEANKGSLSPEQFELLAGQVPQGIPGTTRSIFSYGLLVLLAAAVFHLLVFGGPDALPTADKILTVLAGALSSIIGFYFGSKATKEGVDTGAAQRPDPPTPADPRITGVDPKKAKPGDDVTITGSGFGAEQGTVQFGDVSVPKVEMWKDTVIRVKVPATPTAGPTTVFVNPVQGRRVGIAFEISTPP
jgi:hypothetical protein